MKDTTGKDFRYDGHVQYVDWLVNDSPMADVFLEKNPEWIVDNFFVLDTEKISGFFMCAAIAARHSWEFPDKVERWWRLVDDYGCDPCISFIICYNFYLNDKELVAAHWGDHPCMGGNASLKYYKNFYNKERQINSGPLFADAEGYGQVDSTWGGYTYKEEKLASTLSKVINVSKKKIVNTPTNPWATVIEKERQKERTRDGISFPVSVIPDIQKYLLTEFNK